MSKPPGLINCRIASCQCLVGTAETEKDNSQDALCVYVRVVTGLIDEGAVGVRIIKRKHLFQMRPGRDKSAGKHQVSTGGIVTQNESGGIVALTAQTQQIRVQPQRQIEFPADHVVPRLPIRYPKELR